MLFCGKIQKKSLSLLHISKKSSTFAPNFFKYPSIMAKQSGLHQIRGKVGEHSYYRQTGVNSGLIRGINQGLSSRVKTGDEYANTRLNNAEFGAACNVAGVLGRTVVPKYRPMVLPFSQSIMAKKILELAKAHVGFWGQRVVTSDDTAELAQVLTDTSKLKIGDFMSIELSRTSASEMSVVYALSEAQVNFLVDLGVSGVNVKASTYDVRTGQYSSDTNRILRSSVRLSDTQDNDEELTRGSETSNTLDLTVGTVPAPSHFTSHKIVVVVVQPYRTLGGTSYTLQEYCMFAAYQVPAQA